MRRLQCRLFIFILRVRVEGECNCPLRAQDQHFLNDVTCVSTEGGLKHVQFLPQLVFVDLFTIEWSGYSRSATAPFASSGLQLLLEFLHIWSLLNGVESSRRKDMNIRSSFEEGADIPMFVGTAVCELENVASSAQLHSGQACNVWFYK